MSVVAERPLVRGLTIDGPFSRDLDDAIWLTRLEGGWLLDVSIADVSSGIPKDSEMDIEARKRGFTRYYAKGNDPMVPRELSEDRLSLWEGRERNTITVSIPIAKDTTLGVPIIRETRLMSAAKLSYELVDVIIREQPRHEFHAMLDDCNTLAEMLLERRRQNGALVVYDIFSGWRTTEDGCLEKILPEFQHLANIIIQEFMILTNETVARFLAERDAQAIFRNHSVKSVGADRKSLLADLSKSVADPKVFRIETLQSKISLVMNRATYNPVITGHFGLNLPAYLHFTSPIRRYADLVNHRIITALVREEPVPYTPDELLAISQEMTRISFEIKDRERAAVKAATSPVDKKTAEAQQIRGLCQTDFSKITEMSASSVHVSEGLVDEAVRRCRQNEILPRDAQQFLFGGNQADEAWIRIKKETFTWLSKHPEHAVTIFNLALQKQMIPSVPTYDITSTGPAHAMMFTGSGRFDCDDSILESGEIVGTTKKHAQQLICLKLIALFLSQKQQIEVDYQPVKVGLVKHAVPSASAMSVTSSPTPSRMVPVSGAAEQNSKNRILELCQKFKWQQPKFTTVSAGPDHMRTFRTKAMIEIGGNVYEEEGGESNSKKDAEKLAADALLKKITTLLPAAASEVVAANPFAILDDCANYVSVLQEFLVKKGKTPSYTFDQKGPPHAPTITCTCTVEMGGGRRVSRTEKGPNNKAAKQRAAKAVFEALK